MARQTIEHEISGHKFRLVLLGTTDAITFLSRAGRLIEPALGAGATGENARAKAIAAVGQMLRQFDPKELTALLRMLFTGCTADEQPLFDSNGKPVAWDDFFAGKMGLLAGTVVWAVTENLGDFTGPLADLSKKAAAMLGVARELQQQTGGDGSTSSTTTSSSAS